MLNDTKKVLDRMHDKIVGDLIVISNCKNLFEEELSYNIDEDMFNDYDNLADSLIVVSSDIFTMKEVLDIDKDTIDKDLLNEYGLSYNLIENFHLKLQIDSYRLKKIISLTQWRGEDKNELFKK